MNPDFYNGSMFHEYDPEYDAPQDSARPEPPAHGFRMGDIDNIAKAASELFDALVDQTFSEDSASDITACAMPEIVKAVLAR